MAKTGHHLDVVQRRGNHPSLEGEHSPSIVRFPRAAARLGLEMAYKKIFPALQALLKRGNLDWA